MPLIEVKNLSVAFEGNQVFNNLNFTVNEGECLCILGENGSGKTTLMRCILNNGIRYCGDIICHGFKPSEIGWLPQRTEVKKDFPASVIEIVLSGFGSKSFLGLTYSTAQKKKAKENMELLEIADIKHRSFMELSGGQQQRVLLCRALCAAERVLLLDEPLSGLDTAAQNELYNMIEKLLKKGLTIIMISHDIERTLSQATNILHIADSDYFYGSTQEYRKSQYYKGGAV